LVTVTHKFNDDLLLSEVDRDLAARIFPELVQFLDFPELRAVFSAHDQPANTLKKKRRASGVSAIAMGVLALVGAASAPLLPEGNSAWPVALGALAALLGIASMVVGGFGVFSSSSRDAWLHHRLVTERIRQFHFQNLVCRLPDVLNAIENKQAMELFLEQRRARLAAFAMDHEGHETSKLKAVLDDSDESEFQLVPLVTASGSAVASGTAENVLEAYKLLRFGHQIQYANWMLRPESVLVPSSAAGQRDLLRAVAITSMAAVFLLHLLVAASLVVKGSTPGHLLDVAIVWFAIFLMAARAFEEGVQPGREIERYSHYRANMKRLLRDFDLAKDLPEKQRLMLEAERTAYREMRAFLQLHHDARFVL
jgi:hypothetical protein